MEITFAIIKPDAVRRYYTGDIIKRIESSGLHISGMRLIHLTRGQAEAFYDVHKDRPFFGSLCDYMTSGPVVVMALSGENAVSRWRQLMGATNPNDAGPGTIRKDFGQNIEQNAAHGSDGPETAAREVGFFFSQLDLVR
jgi:nucleoside-diphosphate kinase